MTPRESLAMLLAACLAAGLAAWSVAAHWFIDLRVYMLGATHAFDPDLYDQTLPGTNLPFTYPPFAAVLFSPLGHAPFGVVAGVMAATSFAALVLITRRVVRIHGLSLSAPQLVAVATAALALEPVWATFSFGQINLLVAALCLLDLTGPRSVRGIGTGIAAGLKLTPLFFVLHLVVTRQYRAAGFSVAAFATTVGLGFVANPHGAWVFWSEAIHDTSRVGAVHYSGNQSLSGDLARIVGAPAPGPVMTACQAAAVVAALVASRAVHRRGRFLDAVMTAAFGMLVVSPVSWTHHWVWAAPALLTVMLRAARRRPTAQGVAIPPDRWMTGLLIVFTVVVFVSRSVWWPPSGGDKELAWTLGDKIIGNTYIVVAVAWVAWALRVTRTTGGARRRHPVGSA